MALDPRRQAMRAQPPRGRVPAASPEPKPADVFVPRPDLRGSAICLLGFLLTGLFAEGTLPTDVARFGAIGCGLSLLLSLGMDARHGVRNLVRADLLALLSLYYLTFCEFLFPQPSFVTLVSVVSTKQGVVACLVGFAGMVLGRHLMRLRRQPFEKLFTAPVSPALILTAFFTAFFLGFAYMLACSDWDPIVMTGWFFEPRFSQPWSRGALGDWRALLHELEMMLFLVPPLGGVIFARRKRYGFASLLVVGFGVLFVLFYGFSSGTRYFIAAYLVTLLAGFAFACSAAQRKEVIAAAIGAGALMLISTVLMLEFRSIGLRAYLTHDWLDFRRPEATERTLYVDYNLYVICRIADTFPGRHPYLGFEVPFLAIVRPVPRALWPAKPLGLSYPIEDVIGANGWTVAATFIGEAYMSGGYAAVFLIALTLGALARGWNLLASPRNSEFGVLIYASGFFAAAMAMRSVFVLTTALLPSIAGIVVGFFVIRRVARPAPTQRRPVPSRRPPAPAMTRP